MFFCGSDDALPSGYTLLSREIENIAKDLLKDERARFVFRLFILGHGDEDQEREDMVPIYSTTCAVQGTSPSTRTALVLQRTIDEDFAKCPLNHLRAMCGLRFRDAIGVSTGVDLIKRRDNLKSMPAT